MPFHSLEFYSEQVAIKVLYIKIREIRPIRVTPALMGCARVRDEITETIW